MCGLRDVWRWQQEAPPSRASRQLWRALQVLNTSSFYITNLCETHFQARSQLCHSGDKADGEKDGETSQEEVLATLLVMARK